MAPGASEPEIELEQEGRNTRDCRDCRKMVIKYFFLLALLALNIQLDLPWRADLVRNSAIWPSLKGDKI